MKLCKTKLSRNNLKVAASCSIFIGALTSASLAFGEGIGDKMADSHQQSNSNKSQYADLLQRIAKLEGKVEAMQLDNGRMWTAILSNTNTVQQAVKKAAEDRAAVTMQLQKNPSKFSSKMEQLLEQADRLKEMSNQVTKTTPESEVVKISTGIKKVGEEIAKLKSDKIKELKNAIQKDCSENTAQNLNFDDLSSSLKSLGCLSETTKDIAADVETAQKSASSFQSTALSMAMTMASTGNIYAAAFFAVLAILSELFGDGGESEGKGKGGDSTPGKNQPDDPSQQGGATSPSGLNLKPGVGCKVQLNGEQLRFTGNSGGSFIVTKNLVNSANYPDFVNLKWTQLTILSCDAANHSFDFSYQKAGSQTPTCGRVKFSNKAEEFVVDSDYLASACK